MSIRTLEEFIAWALEKTNNDIDKSISILEKFGFTKKEITESISNELTTPSETNF